MAGYNSNTCGNTYKTHDQKLTAYNKTCNLLRYLVSCKYLFQA